MLRKQIGLGTCYSKNQRLALLLWLFVKNKPLDPAFLQKTDYFCKNQDLEPPIFTKVFATSNH